MDYSKSYSAGFSLYSVDRETWQDGRELPGLVGATVERDIEDDLIESCSIKASSDIENGYVRLYMECEGDEGERVPLVTALMTTPRRTMEGGTEQFECDGYSTLKPASDRILEPSWYLARGSDPVAAACRLLADSCAAPVTAATSDIFTDHTIAREDGDTALSMALYLLDGTGYSISIDGNGAITIGEDMNEPVAVLDDSDVSLIIDDGMEDGADLYDAPNVFMAFKGRRYAIAKNVDDDSPLSVQNIGWEKWEEKEVNNLNGETLQGYANRRLQEISVIRREIEYDREWDSRIKCGSLVDMRLQSSRVTGTFKIETQKLKCGNGVVVSETASRSSDVWRA